MTIESATNAPYLTKSILSLSSGSSILIASCNSVPLHEIPSAMAAPYLTCGLKLSPSRLSILGTYS